VKTKTPLHPGLVAVVEDEFGEDPIARELFERFLGAAGSGCAPVSRLVEVAGGRGISPRWAVRRAAVLILEAHLFALPADDPAGFEPALRAIAAEPASGLAYPPGPSVLAEGYTKIDPQGFIGELRERLSRHARVHRRIAGPATTPEALRDFLALAREESKLTLARYLFSPSEVADRVRQQVRTSRGVPAPFDSALVKAEAGEALRAWPAYERAVARALLSDPEILWADETTSRQLGALVEYPLGTVVLVVKPPGSHLEIEIKRAGRPGNHPLSVVHDRGGCVVSASHRLDGGSMGTSLRSEANNAAAFARIYRLIHGRHAPVSVSLAHRVIYEVPLPGGETVDLLDYFTRSDVFGPGFGAMREAMRSSIHSFCQEWGTDALDVPGELGLTVSFLGQVNPVQAILGQTSSYRLDLLAAYLSEGGPELYLREALGEETSRSPSEARRFTEAILDEALGGFLPVESDGLGHLALIDAVLAEPANRRKADAAFLDLAAQAGRVWGTLFAIKGYSLGESFVGRNVGLRSVWEGGAWWPRLLFMDHDMLSVPREKYLPDYALWGCYSDARYILFDPPSGRRSELDLLATIYRVDGPTGDRGRSEFLLAARGAYQRTKAQLASDPKLHEMFSEPYRNDLLDWEDAYAAFVSARLRDLDQESSSEAGVGLLRGRGHAESVLEMFREVAARFAEFLTYIAVIFEPEQDGEC
jgi:hypothetical protein